MPEQLNRRLSALEAKSRGVGPRVVVFNERRDGTFDLWRLGNVAPLEAEGHRPLVVKIRYLSVESGMTV